MNFVGKGQPLTRAGLNKVLAALGLGPNDAAYIWTVAEVETAGLTQGRPQILFERHIFRKYTNDSDAREISGAPGACGLLSEQYDKRTKALALCAKAKLSVEPALQSASWGMGQVMGFNYDVARYKSAANMIQAMVRNEDAQLAAMAGYLRANGVADKLIKKDWTALRRVTMARATGKTAMMLNLPNSISVLPAARCRI